jgi:hypothetical protein
MTNPTFVAPVRSNRPGPLVLVPAMAVPLVIYNLVEFLIFGGNPGSWSNAVLSIFMVSGVPWILTLGDIMMVFGLLCLFLEIIKSTRIGRTSVLEHSFSTIVFILYLIEFILVGGSASSTFFLLMAMSLIDVVAGFSVSMSAAERDVTYTSG